MKKASLVLGVLLLLSVMVFSEDLRGNEVVSQGMYRELQGTLYSEHGEYYLDTGSEVYCLHLGPDWFATEIGFAPEYAGYAEVKGLVHALDCSPSTLSLAGEVYSFREQDGQPLWAGRGNRQNQSSGNEKGAGSGRNAGANRN